VSRPKNIAVILAGGKGERFENSLPKQFVKLAGKSVIEYTIDAFNRHRLIDEIIIVSRGEHSDRVWEIVKKNGFSKVEKVIAGGQDRFGSTYAALGALQEEEGRSKVLFHDAVRPLVDEITITRCLEALDEYEAIDTAIDATDTIIRIDQNDFIREIPNRAYMKRGQTPQGFRLETIRRAYWKALDLQRRTFTCDCGVVREMLPQVEIRVVKSSEKNLKITYPIDLYVAEKYIQMGVEYTFSDISLYDLAGKHIVIFGASSGIGLEIAKQASAYGAKVSGTSRRDGVDISKREDIEKFINALEEPVDIVINTASILIKKPLEMMSFEEIDRIVSTNYIGAINVAHLTKRLLEKRGGMLINFASSSYTRGRANYALYSSSKAAIVNLTQALSQEWEEIKVNCINPERTKTPMRERNFGIEPEEMLLKAKDVAVKTLKLALSDVSGLVVDVRR
jgi:2-C-methyl-D-erythritol 4-phosphate cytidylyltransferase